MHWRATSFDETKARCVIRKRCCWIPEHPVVHHGPTHVPVLLQGSVVWGVHVPGREWLLLGLVRRREAPLPSLWTRPLFSSPCSTCLSPLSLTAGQAFLQCQTYSLYSSELSIALWMSSACCVCVCECANAGARPAACRQEETWLDRRGSLSFKLSFAEHFIFKNIGGKFHSHVTHCWVSAIKILFCFGLELHYSLSLEFTISNISQNHLSINPNLTLTSRIENFIKLVFIFLFYINKICLILFCYWLKWGCSSKYWKLSITECCHQMSAPTCNLYIIDYILFGSCVDACVSEILRNVAWFEIMKKKGLNSKHSGKSSKENMLFGLSVNCVSSCIMTDLH